jgi:hypothetical protein
MPRTALVLQEVAVNGVVPSYVAGDAANGHQFPNDGKSFLHVKNGGGSPINVTLQVPVKFNGLTITNPVIAVANGSEKMIGPFDSSIFNQAGGLVYVDLSGATSVTLAAIHIPGR